MKFRIVMMFLLLLVPVGCDRQAEQPGENPQLAEARKENADLQRQIEGYKQELAAKQEQLDNAQQEIETMKQSQQNRQPVEAPPPSESPDPGQPQQQMETPPPSSGTSGTGQ